MTEAGFDAGRDRWLDRQGLLRNVVRQELVRRQLEVHLALPPASVLDVGAGQGTQAIHLARQGYEVVAVEPDPQMRAACEAALAAEPAAVRGRISVLPSRRAEGRRPRGTDRLRPRRPSAAG